MNFQTLIAGVRWLPIRNTTAEPIPPFSLVEVYEIDNNRPERPMLLARKPSRTDASPNIAVTDGFQIPPGANGVATFDHVVMLSLDEGEEVPQAGRTLGAIEDSWRPSTNGGGFISCGWPASRGSDPSRRFLAIREGSVGRVYGLLTSALPAANSITDPSTGTMVIYKPTDIETSPITVASTGITITLVNRDESLEGDNAAFCKAEWIDGEWQPYWVGCP